MNDGSRDLATASTAPADLRKTSLWPAGTSALRTVFESLGDNTEVTFRAELVDGSVYQNRPGVPQLNLRFNRASAQWRVLMFGHIGLLESYFDGALDIEGDFPLA